MATSTAKKLQPIIVKRIKKAAHAHHGGAWKIAYADFVTAMMAFFLLMWLLGSTAKGDLQGIASYFQSPLKVEMAGGPGAGSASSIVPGGGKDLTRTTGEVRRSDGTSNDPSKVGQAGNNAKAEQARQDARRLAALRGKIEDLITANPKLREFRSQIKMEVTNDGLEIQIVDAQNRPMFDTGSALVKSYMREILREVGTALNGIENRVSLAGHTDAAPYGNGDRGYGNWELSADRANASRRELVAAGMPLNQLARITGLASSDLLLPDDPRAPQNRRITITVLTQEAEKRLLGHRGPVTRNALPPSLAGGSGGTANAATAEATAGETAAQPAAAAPAAAAAPSAPASPDRVTN